jgi:hypothetical protein
MTDLQTMLSNAARPGHNPAVPTDVVDADVARAHRALVHRRARRTGTRTVLAAALALGSFAVVHIQHGPSSKTAAAPVTVPAPAPARASRPTVSPAIKLVAYTGTQPPGYTVDSIPAGWEIQGVDDYALVIAPIGYPSQSIYDFEGKLVVMLDSVDEQPPTDGVPVPVGSGKGLVSHLNPGEPILYFTDATGHGVIVQQPPALHWTDAELGQFGAGVHVNATARQGHG